MDDRYIRISAVIRDDNHHMRRIYYTYICVIRCSTSGDISYAISLYDLFSHYGFYGEGIIIRLWSILTVQITWLVLFCGLYKFLWHHGIRKFTAVGI